MELKRYSKNPILSPTENSWESECVFNCAAIYHNNIVHILYRARGDDRVSRLGYAASKDGFTIDTRLKEPIFEPESEFEEFGCEDPRITFLDDRFYIAYVGYSKHGTQVSLASTQDFKNFDRYGVILSDKEPFPHECNKDAALFPEKINGRYALLHRIPPDIWIAYSDNMTDWHDHQIVMAPSKNLWEFEKIGAGAQPIKTEHGWLLFYHGVGRDKAGERCYSLGAALLDLTQPARVITRYNHPVLKPELDYELKGDVPNVVFTCGAVEIDDTYYVYYGGADTVIGVATIDKPELLSELLKFKSS